MPSDSAPRNVAPEREQCRLLAGGADLEQKRLAQLLHDTLSQSFSGTELLASMVLQKARRLCPELATDLQTLSHTIKTASQDVRLLECFTYSPLPTAGLVAALRNLAATPPAGTLCRFEGDILAELTDAVAAHVLAIARETVGLAALKRASKMGITLRQESLQTTLRVTSDVSLAKPLYVDGPAWRLLSARAVCIGGELNLTSDGCTLTLSFGPTAATVG